MSQSFVRRSDGSLIGHTLVHTHLTWCAKEGVPRAIDEDKRNLQANLREMARERGVQVEIAYDGVEVSLR
jgi:hypothetical protein